MGSLRKGALLELVVQFLLPEQLNLFFVLLNYFALHALPLFLLIFQLATLAGLQFEGGHTFGVCCLGGKE